MPVFELPQEHLFPKPELAEEDGLLAVGGDLSPGRLLTAYQLGIFPWYSGDSPILWWSPDPRWVLFPAAIKVSKSMRKVMRRQEFVVRYDTAFSAVVGACAEIPRRGQEGTWLTSEMEAAYIDLHRLGFAHSVEAWQDGELVGGLYGVSLGGCFFGESMFARRSNASKAALIALAWHLAALEFKVIDCQVHTPHLESMGAQEVSRAGFRELLREGLQMPLLRGKWTDLMAEGELG
ncbi:MAG: leucyl/phenylalanyl-tRNA--protein transferase [Bacteroidota bacterium]